ncbi:MAG: hypothetical protein K2J20_05135, partial [Bacilli bacterium]|nr:hypothetical protein [Bacilli bacterium]
MKKKSLFILFVLSMWFGCMKVDASASDPFFKVTDEQSFIECLSKDNMCELSKDVTLSARQLISKNIILDLKDHTLTAGDDLSVHAGLLKVNHGAKLTIMDSVGNGKISTGKSKEVWAAIDLVDTTESDKPAELIVNGGTIEGFYYGITGNGNYHNTSITINGGTIKTLNEEDSVAIFQPQVGKLEVNGGTITGATGIEIRSGNLTVNGGTITGTAKEFLKMVNGNGTTTTGAGIAVAQHTTKNEINVVINNGNISGIYGLYEWNPHN